jgi:hypothetical protein
MPRSTYQVPTSSNIVYTEQQANLSDTNLSDPANDDKVLINSGGTIDFIGFNSANKILRIGGDGYIDSSFIPPSFEDLQFFDTTANFPATGDSTRWYVDRTTNFSYRWNGSAYVEFNVNLSNYYTKTQTDTTTNALSNRINPLETLKTNADASFTLSGANVVLAKNIDMNTKTITNCPTLTSITTNYASADTALSNRITPLETQKTNEDASFTLTGTNVVLNKNIDMNTKTITNCPTLTTITTNYTSADTALSNRITPIETFKTYCDTNFLLDDASNFKIIRPLDMTTHAITNCPTITTINSNASTEVTNRTNADTTLQNQINTINTNAFTKNATGTQTINSSIDCNGGSVTNSNIMQCGSLRTGSINAQTGTYISSVTSVGLEFNYGKNIVLDSNRSGRETNSCTISANYVDALNSLVIIGKGDTADTRRVYLEDLAYVRLDLAVPKLNSKICDGSHRLTLPNIYSSTATVTGVNFFQYTAPAGYKMYSVQWVVATDPQFSGWTLSTDGTVTSINVSMTSGQQIRCIVLLCQD